MGVLSSTLGGRSTISGTCSSQPRSCCDTHRAGKQALARGIRGQSVGYKPESSHGLRNPRSRLPLHCCPRRCLLEGWPVASVKRTFLARFRPAPREYVAASPAGLVRTADAQELGRQGSGSVAARMTAVPFSELTLSTPCRPCRMPIDRYKADAKVGFRHRRNPPCDSAVDACGCPQVMRWGSPDRRNN